MHFITDYAYLVSVCIVLQVEWTPAVIVLAVPIPSTSAPKVANNAIILKARFLIKKSENRSLLSNNDIIVMIIHVD